AALIALTKSLAKELAGQGDITVNAISPAVISTPILEGIPQSTIDYMVSRIPLGRTGRPEEVAALVHYLASAEASFTTGQCYDISGGPATYLEVRTTQHTEKTKKRHEKHQKREENTPNGRRTWAWLRLSRVIVFSCVSCVLWFPTKPFGPLCSIPREKISPTYPFFGRDGKPADDIITWSPRTRPLHG